MNFILRVALLGLFVVVCTLAVIHFQILAVVPALLMGGAIIIGLVLHARLSTLNKELKELKARSAGITEFEKDINRRLDSLEVEMAGGPNNPRGVSGRQTEKLAGLIEILQRRLEAIEKGAPIQFQNLTANVPKKVTIEPNTERSSSGIIAKPDVLDGINLKEALAGDGLSMHLQPIVELPTRKPLHYEALMRLRMKGKDFLDANQFLRIAEKGGLMPTIDKKIFFSAIRMLRTLEVLNKQAGLFCNVSKDILSDQSAFDELAEFLQANANYSSSLVLEVTQRSFRALDKKAKARLAKLANMGFAISLDQVMDLRLDMAKLRNSGVSYVKIPAGILLHSNLDEGPNGFANQLAEHKIGLVATEVDREADVISLIDFGAKTAQGNVFAPPRAVKAKLLEGPVMPPPNGSAPERVQVVA